jgi:type IV fimbrial biogenesis protein FimT
MLGNERKNGMSVSHYQSSQKMSHKGMTLIELIITLSIASISIALGLPTFIKWTQETSVRSQAEQLQAVILSARSYAVARNEWVRLQFTAKTGLVSWQIGCVRVTTNCSGIIDSKLFSESNPVRIGVGLANTTIDIKTPLNIGVGLPAFISFNSQGMAANQMKDKEINRIDIMHKDKPQGLRLMITIEMSGEVKICNPQAPKTNVEFCA